jgi:hypothetical protein
MPLKEFVDFGYLHELNRQFLHPLGLAISVMEDSDDGTVVFDTIWHTSDPDGMIFAEAVLDKEKTKRVMAEQVKKKAYRKKVLGYEIQPT